MISLKALAYDIEVVNEDGITIYYNFTNKKTELAVCRGNTGNYSGNIVVPSYVDYNNKTYYVSSINSRAFSDCTELVSIVIPASVSSIGDLAFSGCSNLLDITITNPITSIGNCAFSRTAWYNSQANGLVYVGKTAYAYKGTMPSNTVIALKEGTIAISDQAFYGCYNLKSISIPNSVKSIGHWAFYGCTNLSTITIPDSVKSIGSATFYGCSSLKNISIPNSLSEIGSDAFEQTAWYDNQNNGLVYAGNVVYKYKGEMPSNTKIILNEGTLGIAGQTFYEETNLTNIEIPNSVIFIGGCAFQGCTSLANIRIPESVTCIGEQAFYGCTTLTDVFIPNSVSYIGDFSFFGCTSLVNVRMNCLIPIEITEGMFSNRTKASLYVPYGSKSAYEAADYWKEFKEIIEIEDDYDTDISQMEDVIYTEAASGLAGTTIDLCMKMKNVLTPVGCSFKLTLPEGVRLQTDADGDVVYELGSRAKKMSLTMQDWGDGSYDFALTPSSATATITGNDDTFITFYVVLPDDMEAGDYKLKLTRCLIQSKTDGTTKDYALSDVTTTLTVEDYMMGDVNGDRTITPSDAIMTLYHYFSVEQTGFNAKAADVNGDGTVTPADAIETLYMYFGTSSNAARQKRQICEQQ